MGIGRREVQLGEEGRRENLRGDRDPITIRCLLRLSYWVFSALYYMGPLALRDGRTAHTFESTSGLPLSICPLLLLSAP